MKPKPTDIVLDVDLLGKVGVSYLVFIYNDSMSISSKWLDDLNYIRVLDDKRKPIIELIAIIDSSG